MSYCRFSSDDYACDVYVYADVMGGYTTHVAKMRYRFLEPLPPRVSFEQDQVAYVNRMVEVTRRIDDAERVPIELEGAGESYNDPDPGSCADRLQALKNLGFIVPQYAIDALREEAHETEEGG